MKILKVEIIRYFRRVKKLIVIFVILNIIPNGKYFLDVHAKEGCVGIWVHLSKKK